MTHLTDLFKPEWQFVLPGLYAGLVVAAICAYLGVYVVLKRIVFVGAALSELATVGVCGTRDGTVQGGTSAHLISG